jgi:hypothetical protein
LFAWNGKPATEKQLMNSKRFQLTALDKRPWLHLLFYIFSFGALLLSNKIAPTTLAGPGLDMFVFFAFVLAIVVLVVRSAVQKGVTLVNRLLIICIHVAGMLTLYWWMNKPS